MRIISFSKMWPKLQQETFTTFRFPRKDAGRGRDWAIGERVQVYYKSRSPDRKRLGAAEIVGKQSKLVQLITEQEAIKDGFPSGHSEMVRWLKKAHSIKSAALLCMNKLTLRWIEHEDD
jgi:hypothetical protein